ncbi:MAG: protein tyrosine phosphatase family protein [Cyanobacteria bacterium J06621_8]
MEMIPDYYLINDALATSGQPTPQQFGLIAQAGYQAVINLAISSSSNAVANEGAIVTDLGLIYVHIPVLWDAPQIEDVVMFFKMMQAFEGQKIWVHCAKNMRVSCFIYLWQKHVLLLGEEQARYPMNQIWQPTGIWQQLIDNSETALANYLCSYRQ